MTAEDLERVRKAVVRKYPITCGIALNGLEIELTKSVQTAAVVGEKNDEGIVEVKNIKVNPDFFELLSFSERVFVLAHEALHIALKHFRRAVNKPNKDVERKYKEYCEKEQDEQKRKRMYAKLHKKYQNIWNIATDACINAFLKKDGLTFPDNVIDPRTGEKMQFVDIKDGLYKSAEKIYEFLVKQEEEKEKTKKQNNEQQQSSNNSNRDEESQGKDENNSSNQPDNADESIDEENEQKSKEKPSMGDLDDIDVDNYDGFDSHEEWTGEEDLEKKVTSETYEGTEEEKTTNTQEDNNEIDDEDILKKELESREQDSTKKLKDALKSVREGSGLKKYVPVNPVVSWKRLLVGILEKTEEVWGTRRASRFNPNARIEERTYEKLPSVEVVLDTSGSISNELLKGFLLQLYPLFEELYGEVSIKVGCFADDFYGFSEIKSKNDILNYTPDRGAGTDFEKAATAFSPDPGRTTTKIVFTDGAGGNPQKTRNDSIIWIVFGNSVSMKPLGGRIIRVSDEEYKKMTKIQFSTLLEEEQKGYRK